MTIKEKKLILIKALGLEIGDTIKFDGPTKYIVYEKDDDIILKSPTSNSYEISVFQLILNDWIKIEKPMKYGNVKCKDIDCENCPLCLFDCSPEEYLPNKSLYELLDYSFDYRKISKNSNIYKAYKEELDKDYIREELENDN